MKEKLLLILRVPAVRKILITLLIAGLATAGIAVEPEVGGALVDAVSAIATVL